mmetsp:Transcript_33997/g.105679  ORF Transcript_33997/g.105679 Transcript_33997/m.105679 type:complete len:174 (+) Transcript_33997:109-630(+)
MRRPLGVVLFGARGVGKTQMLQQFISDKYPVYTDEFLARKEKLVNHHSFKEGASLTWHLLDCSGKEEAMSVGEEWFRHAQWVVLVYDVANMSSVDFAISKAKAVQAAGATPVLLGNTYNAEKGRRRVAQSVIVDNVMKAKDIAARNGYLSFEGASLTPILEFLSEEAERGSRR